MLRVGVDMIEVARVERALTRHEGRFLQRFFTEQECRICEGNAMRLAARFAAKEAVSKALGTGIGDVGWKDIEITKDDRNRPVLLLHGNAAMLASELGLHEWDVSLSHTEGHAIAFVVAFGR